MLCRLNQRTCPAPRPPERTRVRRACLCAGTGPRQRAFVAPLVAIHRLPCRAPRASLPALGACPSQRRRQRRKRRLAAPETSAGRSGSQKSPRPVQAIAERQNPVRQVLEAPKAAEAQRQPPAVPSKRGQMLSAAPVRLDWPRRQGAPRPGGATIGWDPSESRTWVAVLLLPQSQRGFRCRGPVGCCK